MQKNLIAKLAQIHKCKAKIVKKFGTYWYTNLTEKEWDDCKEDVVTILPPGKIKNKEELT